MAAIVARSRAVFARDSFGQFAEECSAAAARTAEKTAKEGAKTSRRLAPSGEKRDTRGPHKTPLKRSIKWRMTGAARAEWYSTSGHALHVEFGTGPHPITGKLVFEWLNAGKTFYWADPRYNNWTEEGGVTIWHPGARAQPFLRPAYAMIAQGKMMQIAKSEFPG